MHTNILREIIKKINKITQKKITKKAHQHRIRQKKVSRGKIYFPGENTNVHTYTHTQAAKETDGSRFSSQLAEIGTSFHSPPLLCNTVDTFYVLVLYTEKHRKHTTQLITTTRANSSSVKISRCYVYSVSHGIVSLSYRSKKVEIWILFWKVL